MADEQNDPNISIIDQITITSYLDDDGDLCLSVHLTDPSPPQNPANLMGLLEYAKMRLFEDLVTSRRE